MSPSLRVGVRDLLREALSAVMAHRLRSSLSVIGIVFGVATVVTALAIGEGARRSAIDEVGALGIDNVFARAVGARSASSDASRPLAPVLTVADLRAVGSAIPGAVAIAGMRRARGDIDVGDRQATAAIAGVSPAWRRISNIEIARGRWLLDGDEHSHRRVAVLGGALARELFVTADPVGSRIRAGGAWFVVVGTLRDRDEGMRRAANQAFDVDRAVLVPLSAMDVTLGEGDSLERVTEIGVRTAGAEAVERTAEAMAALLQRRHPDLPEYEVIVPRELLRAKLRAQRTFDAVVVGVGLLALLISGVGIMNIMLASVAERTNEIGVRRAFGARRVEIVAQFALEAMILCGFGAVVGVPLGAGMSAAVAQMAGWPVSLSVSAVALALGLATGTGLGFSIFPARLAAAIQPIDALRVP